MEKLDSLIYIWSNISPLFNGEIGLSYYVVQHFLIKPFILFKPSFKPLILNWTSCCSSDNLVKIFRLQKCCARVILDAQQRHSIRTLHTSQVAHQPGAYPGFRSMKRLGVFLHPPGWDASPSQGYPQQ